MILCYVTMAIKYTLCISEPVLCILTEWNVINWSLIRVPVLIYVNIICIAKRLFAHIHARRNVAVWERRGLGLWSIPQFSAYFIALFLSQRIQAPPITAHNELHQIITSSAGLKNKLIHMADHGSHRGSFSVNLQSLSFVPRQGNLRPDQRWSSGSMFNHMSLLNKSRTHLEALSRQSTESTFWLSEDGVVMNTMFSCHWLLILLPLNFSMLLPMKIQPEIV